jgi:quinol-cytochrome oxidoreductase complex cytochrome b subunit
MIPFHRVLISTAIVFCAGFAVWGWREYQHSHAAWALASAIAFAVFALAFAVYLSQLKRFLRK